MEMKGLKEKLQKDKKILIILMLGVLGILLLLGSEVFDNEKTTNTNDYIESSLDTNKYNQALEQKLSELISEIDKAGRTKVFISLESTEEYVFIANESVDRENDLERERNNSDIKYVIINDNNSSSQKGIAKKIILPKVIGVAIVCEGGDLPVVRQNISDIITSIFDISSTKVSIVKMSP